MKILVYISFCLLVFGCQDVQKPEKPENLIPEATMVEVLSEVYLGNAARSLDNKTIRKNGVKIDSFLFKKYGIDSLQFAKSNAYYASNLDVYSAIFQKIEKKLKTLETEENNRKVLLDSLKRDKIKVNDSIKPSKKEQVEALEEELDTIKTEGLLIDSATSN